MAISPGLGRSFFDGANGYSGADRPAERVVVRLRRAAGGAAIEPRKLGFTNKKKAETPVFIEDFGLVGIPTAGEYHGAIDYFRRDGADNAYNILRHNGVAIGERDFIGGQ